MGSTSTKTVTDTLKISEEDWEYATTQQGQQIAKHRHIDLEGEVALILANALYTPEDQLDIYLFRKQQQKALVEVYCADYLKATHATMCGNQLNIKVIHQHITHRLRDLPFLAFPQSVYLLSEALRGFQECYDKVGPFQLTNRMIGINPKGIVKVWLNQQFAENHPSTERPSLQITASSSHKDSAGKEEALFVRNLVELVREKTQGKKFPLQLEKALRNANGFVQTYSQLEKYCEEKEVWVPDRIIVNAMKSSRSLEGTALKAGRMVNESHATYVPNMKYSQPVTSRDTYVTPYYQTNPNQYYPLTPNNQRNTEIPFIPLPQDYRPIVKSIMEGTNGQVGYTYRPI